MPRFVRLLTAVLLAASLGGCATGYLLDNQVQAFASPPGVPATASYRFERLPSQLADPTQAALEVLADPALHKAGLRRDDAAPRYSVQVTARVTRTLSPWADPWDHPLGWGWGWGSRNWRLHGGLARMESPWFQREVNLVVRELASSKVVFESQAVNHGPWFDNQSVLPAMFEAALQGFPNPPAGPRRIEVHAGGGKAG